VVSLASSKMSSDSSGNICGRTESDERWSTSATLGARSCALADREQGQGGAENGGGSSRVRKKGTGGQWRQARACTKLQWRRWNFDDEFWQPRRDIF
jgi:hypothetical protein